MTAGRFRIRFAFILAAGLVLPFAASAEPETGGRCHAGAVVDAGGVDQGALARLERTQPASHRVLSLVARNIGQFDVPIAFEGPFTGPTEDQQRDLMQAIADELGLRHGEETAD